MSSHNKMGSPLTNKRFEDSGVSLPKINTQQSEQSLKKLGGNTGFNSSSPNKHEISASDMRSYHDRVSNFQETMYSKESNKQQMISKNGNVVINDFLSRERQIANKVATQADI